MKTYSLFIPRHYAALYIAWDLGMKNGRPQQILNALPKDARGWLDMSAFTPMRPVRAKRWTLRDLNNFAAHIREVVSYQEGRLGRKLTGGGGCIVVKSSAG